MVSSTVVVISFQFSTFVSLMQRLADGNIVSCVVISFQFSTFVSLMQRLAPSFEESFVVISFQFSTFVSLMQLATYEKGRTRCCD